MGLLGLWGRRAHSGDTGSGHEPCTATNVCCFQRPHIRAGKAFLGHVIIVIFLYPAKNTDLAAPKLWEINVTVSRLCWKEPPGPVQMRGELRCDISAHPLSCTAGNSEQSSPFIPAHSPP